METPTLNKKQQKSSLSAKKARSKETIKNVLCAPYTFYWPEITPEDNITLQQILTKNLPKLSEKIKIPWRELKNITKSERKKFKEDYARNRQLIVNKNDRQGVIIGINNVTKLLEKNSISVVLISNDVQPKLMVQHVIDLCVLYGIPVITFNNLRDLLKEVCGVASTVFGISKEVGLESNLNLIRENVRQIFEKCPQPINHINYNRFLENDVILVKDNQKLTSVSQESKINEHEIRQSVYLKRDSKIKRVFIPEYSKNTLKTNKMELHTEGFLPFSEDPTPKVPFNVKSYKSLVIKRLKGDPNRNKKKIATLKKKQQ